MMPGECIGEPAAEWKVTSGEKISGAAASLLRLSDGSVGLSGGEERARRNLRRRGRAGRSVAAAAEERGKIGGRETARGREECFED